MQTVLLLFYISFQINYEIHNYEMISYLFQLKLIIEQHAERNVAICNNYELCIATYTN